MNRTVIAALCLLLCAAGVDAKDKSPKLLLEARMFGAGMVAVRGDHLYLRIYDDGNVEYENEVVRAGRPPKYVLRRHKIKPSQLNALIDFLKGAGVRGLARKYPPPQPPLDHVIKLTVLIAHGNESQTVAVENFFPTSSDAKGVYPTELIELLCRIERLRVKASFEITADASAWCSK